jgi:hypothetical protein
MKTMKYAIQLAACVAVAALTAACFGFERKSTVTAPSATGIGTLLGNWTSSNLIPTPGTCTDFKWNVSEQTSNSAKGSFSATCANDLKLTGTAQGTLNGSTILWAAEGNGNAPGLTSCSIKLSGTAEIGIDAVRVPYTGDTCLGKVSGVETLRRR